MVYSPTTSSSALALDDFAAHLNTIDYSQRTRDHYLEGLRCFKEHGFDDVTYENCIAFKQKLIDEGKKANTVNARIHAMNAYLRWKELPIVKEVRINKEPFSLNGMESDAYHDLIYHLLDDGKYQWYVTIKLLAATGMRISEAVQVTYGDLRRGSCSVIGKGRKERTVYFSHNLRETLYFYAKDRPDGEKIISYDAHYVREAFRRIKKRYGITEAMNPHAFRAYFARELYGSTKDVALLKGLLGHDNLKTTYEYIKPTKRSAMETYGRAQNW